MNLSTNFLFSSLLFSLSLSLSLARGDDQFLINFIQKVHERERDALPGEKPHLQRSQNPSSSSLSSSSSSSSSSKEVDTMVKQAKTRTNVDQNRALQTTADADCGNVATIEVVSGQGEYNFYFDDQMVGSRAGAVKSRYEVLVESQGPNVFSFEATRDHLTNFKDNGGIAVTIEVCGTTYGSNSENWICSSEKPWTNEWRSWEYNTTNSQQFGPARMVHQEGSFYKTSNLNKATNNYAIWSSDCSSGGIPEKAYCRLLLDHECPNSCFLKTITPQATDGCWYPCDINTLSYDVCTRYETRLNSMCSNCETEEIETARKNCINYGCSAKQCNSPEDPELTPDLSCLSSCTKAMGTTSRSTCDTQKFYFTQGCDSCGPRALAYAKNLCVNDYKCDAETECFLGSEEVSGRTNYAPAPAPAPGADDSGSEDGGEGNPLDDIPEDTPDVSCFFACLRGSNQYEDNCDKINYIFESGCGSRCPQSTLDWSQQECLVYKREDGSGCTNAECGL